MSFGNDIKCKNCDHQEMILFGLGKLGENIVLFSKETFEIKTLFQPHSFLQEDRLGKLESFLLEEWEDSLDKNNIRLIRDLVEQLTDGNSKVYKLLNEGWIMINDVNELMEIVDQVRCPKCDNIGFSMDELPVMWD